MIALDFNENILPTESGPNLDKMCVQFSDAASSYGILRNFFFAVEPLKMVGSLSALHFLENQSAHIFSKINRRIFHKPCAVVAYNCPVDFYC